MAKKDLAEVVGNKENSGNYDRKHTFSLLMMMVVVLIDVKCVEKV